MVCKEGVGRRRLRSLSWIKFCDFVSTRPTQGDVLAGIATRLPLQRTRTSRSRNMSTAARVQQVEQKLAEGGAQFSFAANEIRLLKEDAVEDASRLANEIVTQLKAQLEAAQALAATVETLQGAAMPPSPHADTLLRGPGAVNGLPGAVSAAFTAASTVASSAAASAGETTPTGAPGGYAIGALS